MNGNKIVVVSGLPDDSVGGIEYWICNGPCDLGKLTEAWDAAGLDLGLLPKKPTPEKAMSLAVNEQKDCRRGNERRVLVSPMRGVQGWVLVEQLAEGEDVSHSVECKVKLEDGRLVVSPAYHPLANAIQKDYGRFLLELDAASASQWLVRLISGLMSVPLKPTAGSFYFVPKGFRDKWREYVAAVKAAAPGYFFQEIPALPSGQVASAVLDAVAMDAQAEAEAMEVALADDKIGSRGLRGRVVNCDKVLSKVGSYEALIGGKLDNVRAQIDALKVKIVEAALAAEAAEDAEKAAKEAAKA